MKKMKAIISILAVLVFVGAISFGMSACKKDKKATTTLTPEQRSEMLSQLEKDDNIVEDPFGDEDDTQANDATTKAGGSSSGSSGNSSGSGSSGNSSGSGNSSTTKSSGSSQTTTKKAATTTQKQDSGSGQPAVVTDENGDYWTGWY